MGMRIGTGFDVHRLVPGRPCRLGGIELPHPTGPLGHSDGDVLLHAVIDALLGAAGLGDIGRHFPDTDPALKGISSEAMLAKVLELLRGESLTAVMARRTLLGWPDAAKVAGSVADVLAVAHRRGVIHRDLSTDNVMLTPAGVKIIDYGLAEATDDGVSRAGDVYALGVLLYRMLTGESPYPTRSPSPARYCPSPRSLAPAPVLTVPGLPRTLAELVRGCMDKKPQDRPTAREASITLWSLLPPVAAFGN